MFYIRAVMSNLGRDERAGAHFIEFDPVKVYYARTSHFDGVKVSLAPGTTHI